MILDIALINGVSIIQEGDDMEGWQVEIDMEELGTHSTVLLRLSLLNFAILQKVVEDKVQSDKRS